VSTQLIKHLHVFVKQMSLQMASQMNAMQLLTPVSQTCINLQQELILLSNMLSVPMLFDVL
jgi:hypothetical protein